MDDQPLFILAGNGPYVNRGCEAIVRGTTKILREFFQDPQFVCISHFQNENQYSIQCQQETDEDIIHLATSRRLLKRGVLRSFWKPETWKGLYQYFFDRNAFSSNLYQRILPYLNNTTFVLSVGGDNYSLDYGVPILFTALDDLVLAHERPLAIWGASVGPFSALPEYEGYMSDHLRKVTGIFARESETIEYLESIGVTKNVFPVADPAFLMDPVKPEEELYIEDGAIGLNLSPLMMKYVTSGDLEKWTAMATAIIVEIARRTERQIYLIPHVTNSDSNDHIFMQRALSLIPGKNENIILVSPRYSAAEMKWIISQMALFVGARTHATIAALSSGVPTLSLAYSIKAKGINRDIFGHTNYCVDQKDLDVKRVSERITSMLDQDSSIRMELRERIPEVQRLARNAGIGLKQLIGEN
jgi:colanic acid/amylovoran biosynthesis protein